MKLGSKLGANLAKQYAQPNVLVSHLNNWFARGKFPDTIPIQIHPNKPPDKAYHPSSATACARALYAMRRGDIKPEKPGLDAQKNFMVGHYYHALIQFAVVDLGFSTPADIEWKFEMKEPVYVKGAVDIAECHVPGYDFPWLFDIKTQMSRQYAIEPSESLMHKYGTQTKIYLYFKKLDKAKILWCEKDTPHRFKETLVNADDAYVESIIERWMGIDEALKKDTPPECSCDKGSKCEAWGLFP